jgi:tetratricopeptide (TPR) repeat protein
MSGRSSYEYSTGERSSVGMKGPSRASLWLAIALAVCSFAVGGVAQNAQPSPAPTSLEIYANAMKQPRISDQIAELERYLSVADNGILKQDALEVLTWDYMRMGSVDHVKQRAQQLLAIDAANPVALAALAEEGVTPAIAAKNKAGQKGSHAKDQRNQKIDAAQAALTALEQLRRPEGMGAGDFAAMRRRAESRLNGVLGLAYVDREEYQQARTPLQQAVAVDPANPQYAYALGLALLMGKDPADQQNAFLNLARAANLTKGTTSGAQISEFARQQFRKAGGKDAEWNGYLAAAVVPESRRTQTVVSASALPPSPAVNPAAASNVGGSANTSRSNTSNSKNPAPSLPGTTVAAPKASPSTPTNERAAVAPPDVNVRPAPTPRPVQPALSTPNPPLSLGILIETSLLTHQNRDAIIGTLKGLVENLRAEDEAAILVFSDQLDFEQDLTANDNLLEEAMSNLRPKPGKALLDGVAFAAGHLRRIGKNSNRVLLVISDGRSGRESAQPISAEIKGVRIDCIGLNADGADQRQLLQRLASYTGGESAFASGPQEFRTAAVRLAQNLGIVIR